MRVLFLGPSSASHVTRWVRYLRERGHETFLGTMHAVPPEEDVNVVRLADDLTPGPTSMRTLFQAVGRAKRAFREIRPDVVCAYYMSSYGLLAALAGIEPWVGAAAGGDVLVDAFDSLPSRVRNRLLLAFTLRRASAMLAWSPHVADRLVELGVPRERVFVQPRGVNRALFRYRPPRRREAADPLRILSIRMLKPLYRVETLLDALALVARAGVPFEARLGGEGSERPRLEAMAEASGIADRVCFLGFVPSNAVPEELAWSDVYVSTSSTDGASSSLFEALSVGTYPIVTDIVANAPFVERDVTGMLFPVGDAAALAAKLVAIAHDESARLAGIEKARNFVENELDYGTNMDRITAFVERTAREFR